MRYLRFLAVPFVLAAQSAESDQRVTQTLISEIQQLRLAIERSTLLNARTQLAISQLQMQETAVARLTAQLDEVRAQAPGIDRRTRLALAEHDQEREEPARQPGSTPPNARDDSKRRAD